jgi:hypothetical protein
MISNSSPFVLAFKETQATAYTLINRKLKKIWKNGTEQNFVSPWNLLISKGLLPRFLGGQEQEDKSLCNHQTS